MPGVFLPCLNKDDDDDDDDDDDCMRKCKKKMDIENLIIVALRRQKLINRHPD